MPQDFSKLLNKQEQPDSKKELEKKLKEAVLKHLSSGGSKLQKSNGEK